MELKVLQVRLGFTAIYVTHDQEEAFGLAEHVVIMNRGRIEAAGSPRDLFWRPPTAFIAKFLGLNLLPGTVVGLSDEPRNRPRGSAWRATLKSSSTRPAACGAKSARGPQSASATR